MTTRSQTNQIDIILQFINYFIIRKRAIYVQLLAVFQLATYPKGVEYDPS